MNRSDVIRAISNQTRVPVAQVETVLGNFLDIIGLSLACGEEVNLRNFGKFEPRLRKAVTKRNPKTGDPLDVPERTTIGFVAAPALKDRVNAPQTNE